MHGNHIILEELVEEITFKKTPCLFVYLHSHSHPGFPIVHGATPACVLPPPAAARGAHKGCECKSPPHNSPRKHLQQQNKQTNNNGRTNQHTKVSTGVEFYQLAFVNCTNSELTLHSGYERWTLEQSSYQFIERLGRGETRTDQMDGLHTMLQSLPTCASLVSLAIASCSLATQTYSFPKEQRERFKINIVRHQYLLLAGTWPIW